MLKTSRRQKTKEAELAIGDLFHLAQIPNKRKDNPNGGLTAIDHYNKNFKNQFSLALKGLIFANSAADKPYYHTLLLNIYNLKTIMVIQSKIPILFPLKEQELPVQATLINGIINDVEVTVEGSVLAFNRDMNGHFRNTGENKVEPAYVAYIARQLSRAFN